MTMNDWPINEIARRAGVTSRTLRHYDAIGLLPASRIASNGYRYYDEQALVRLQRILLLRDLGLGLESIRQVLAGQTDDVEALRNHVAWLDSEAQRIEAQRRAIASTITALTEGEPIMAEEALEGFDHTRYKDEVVERWGADAYAQGDQWWRNTSAHEKTEFMQQTKKLSSDWIAAFESGEPAEGVAAQALAQRHVEWLSGIPGTPAASGDHTAEYITGLADMYVADPRFAANYGGVHGAEFVRDALQTYVEQHWPAER